MKNKLTPLYFWEHMTQGHFPNGFLISFPEEERITAKQIADKLHKAYSKVEKTSKSEAWSVIMKAIVEPDPEAYVKECKDKLTHPTTIMPYFRNDSEKLEKAIMKLIKPTSKNK